MNAAERISKESDTNVLSVLTSIFAKNVKLHPLMTILSWKSSIQAKLLSRSLQLSETSKRIPLRSMETEFNFLNSHSSINCLMHSAQDHQDLKAIMEGLDLMDLARMDLMALDMEKEEVETVVHSRVNLKIMKKWRKKKLKRNVNLKRRRRSKKKSQSKNQSNQSLSKRWNLNQNRKSKRGFHLSQRRKFQRKESKFKLSKTSRQRKSFMRTRCTCSLLWTDLSISVRIKATISPRSTQESPRSNLLSCTSLKCYELNDLWSDFLIGNYFFINELISKRTFSSIWIKFDEWNRSSKYGWGEWMKENNKKIILKATLTMELEMGKKKVIEINCFLSEIGGSSFGPWLRGIWAVSISGPFVFGLARFFLFSFPNHWKARWPRCGEWTLERCGEWGRGTWVVLIKRWVLEAGREGTDQFLCLNGCHWNFYIISKTR